MMKNFLKKLMLSFLLLQLISMVNFVFIPPNPDVSLLRAFLIYFPGKNDIK